jgi:hypothetical protein
MAPQTARRRVIAACDGLCDEQRDIAELLISELVANAVRHPPRGGTGPEIEISVRLLRTDVVLRVEVEDHDGRPLPLVRPPPEPHESGMGLHLVSQLAATHGLIGVDPALLQHTHERPLRRFVSRLQVQDLGPEVETAPHPGRDAGAPVRLAAVHEHQMTIPAVRFHHRSHASLLPVVSDPNPHDD